MFFLLIFNVLIFPIFLDNLEKELYILELNFILLLRSFDVCSCFTFAIIELSFLSKIFFLLRMCNFLLVGKRSQISDKPLKDISFVFEGF